MSPAVAVLSLHRQKVMNVWNSIPKFPNLFCSFFCLSKWAFPSSTAAPFAGFCPPMLSIFPLLVVLVVEIWWRIRWMDEPAPIISGSMGCFSWRNLKKFEILFFYLYNNTSSSLSDEFAFRWGNGRQRRKMRNTEWQLPATKPPPNPEEPATVPNIFDELLNLSAKITVISH